MSGHERIVGEAFGRHFALEADPQILAVAEAEFPYSWQRSTGEPERVWRIGGVGDGESPATASVDGVHLGDGGSAESLIGLVASEIELWVAEHAEGLIFVHAGVVAVDGRAIVLPGLTRAGKSTLVAALVRAGATYYSDEFAPIDADSRVHPYRRSPRQRPDSPATGWTIDLAGDAPPPIPIGLVAALSYTATMAADLATVPGAAAVLALLANTVPARTRPVEALEVIASAVREAACVKGTRGEAELAAPLLLERLLSPCT